MSEIKKEMKKDLTIKQKRFLQEYFKTGNGTRSAMLAYDVTDPNLAASMASQNLSKLKGVVQSLMEAKGLSLGKIIDVVNDAHSATKFILSHTEPDKEVPDHPTRLKAAEIAGKWLGVDTQTNINIQGEKVLVIPSELMGKYAITQNSGDSS